VIFMHDPREALMPNIANVYKMRDAGRSHARTLLAGVVMAIAVGLVVSFFAFINNSYRYGGCNLDTWGMVSAPKVYIDKAIKSLDQPTNGMQPELWNVLLGAAICAVVIYMRLHHLWWPFHPIGLVLAPVWAMHISKGEQEQRLLDREKDPTKYWKLSAGDWEERGYWDAYTEAYEDAIGRCSASHAPWFIIPANHKWFRNLAVAEAIVDALKPCKKAWLEHLEEIGDGAMAEIAQLRQESESRKDGRRP